MSSILIAVPSQQPGGLEATVDSHFGHCAVYTLVTLKDGAITSVETAPAMPHQQGGCMAPVQYLADKKVSILISGGMGMRPLMGFKQVGIDVYYGAGIDNVGKAIEAFSQGKLQPFAVEQTCGGGSGEKGAYA